jgi:hypothetical protein
MSIKSNFEICNDEWKRIVSHYHDKISALDLTGFERVVMLVWLVTGIVENGGFNYLFESDLPGDEDLSLTVEAFYAIGCIEVSSLIASLLKRMKELGSVDTKLENYLCIPQTERDDIDAAFWSEITNINKCLSRFIMSSSSEKV